MVRIFILSEIGFAASFYGLAYYFTSIFGLEGVSIAHSVNYFFIGF